MGQRKLLGGQRTRLRPDCMSKAALSELSTLLRETVTHAGGKGSAVTMDKLAAQLST